MTRQRPVTLVSDAQVLDSLLRLAAAAGCELERVPDTSALRARWSNAPLVVLDATAATELAGCGLQRRADVLVVCRSEPGPELWERAVELGAEQVVTLPAAEEWLVGAFADATDRPAARRGTVVTVLGGRGGSGASVLAVAVGLTALKAGRGCLLIDADPFGGGLDLLLAAEREDGLRWPDVALTGGRVSVSSLRTALPGRTSGNRTLSMLSCDREGHGPQAPAIAAVLESAMRGGELTVCDLPRQLTDASRAALERSDLTVIVVPAEVRAAAAARVVAASVRECGVEPQLVVRGPAPGALRAAEVASAVAAPLLTTMRPEPTLVSEVERTGLRLRRRGPLASTASTILKAVQPMSDLREAS